MNLKTFTAGSMAEALAMVKRELGPHATILHTRTYKQGGLLGFGAKQVVEVTAGDGRGPSRARRQQREARSAPRPQARATGASANAASPHGSAEPTAGDLIRRTYAVAKAELERRQSQTEAPPPPPSPSSSSSATPLAAPPGAMTPASHAPSPVFPVSPDSDQLAQEMELVKRMVGRMMAQQRQRTRRRGAGGDLSDALFNQYLALLEQEVAEELIEQILDDVRGALPVDKQACEKSVREAMKASLAELIPADTACDQVEPTPDGRPRTITLIGPTGVGKTTTIAKLAANFKLKHRKRVGLITMDTYRIAAVEQLRTYANIIGVSLHVVNSPEELTEAVGQCGRCDVVLIDTAGRSQRDDPKLSQLSTFIHAASPHEVHLCLSSTCTQKVLLDTVRRFSRIRIDRIIFTKLDEAVSFGVLLNVVRKVNKRLSFVTTGQEVPHQIEPGCPHRLADLVLGAPIDGKESE